MSSAVRENSSPGLSHQTLKQAATRHRVDTLRVVLFTLLVLDVSRIHQHFSLIEQLRPAFVLFWFAVAYVCIKPRSLASERVLATWPARVVVGLGLLACLSAPFGLSFGNSAKFIIEYYSKIIVFALLLMLAVRSTRDLVLFVWAYVAAGGVLVWLANFVFAPSRQSSFVERLQNLYTYDSNDLGCVLMVALPLTALTLHTSGRWGKVISGLLLVGLGLTIAKSGSRGAFLGLAAVSIIFLLALRGLSVLKRVGIVGAVAAALIIGAPKGYWKQMETLENPESDYNWQDFDGRLQIAKRGVGYMLEHPLLGIGPGNFAKAELVSPDAVRAYGEGKIKRIAMVAPHNSYVGVGSELGVSGLVLWSSLLVAGTVGLWRLRRRLPLEWSRGPREQRFLYQATLYFPAAFVGFAVTSFFVTFQFMDPYYILAAYLGGLQVSVRRAQLRAAGGPLPTARLVPEGARSAIRR